MKFELLAPSHVPDVFRLWSDFETVKFTNWTHAQSLEICTGQVAHVIAYYANEPRHFGPFVIRGDDGAFVGMIGAEIIDAAAGSYDVWYILLREHWGKGLATRALGNLVALVLDSGRVKNLQAEVVAANPASGRVLEKCGFVRDLVIADGFQRHGLSLDLWKYSRRVAREPAL